MSKSKKLLLVLIIVLVTISTLSAKYYCEWKTNMGSFRAILHDDLVPITANNFIDLARDNFYDDLIFHRVIEGFVIQDGDPLGNGYGGPGYSIPDEFTPELRHDAPGVLAMANAGPNTGGSQYYITLAALPSLDDHPINDVVIDSIRIFDFNINCFLPEQEFTTTINENYPFMILATGDFNDPIFRWYLNSVEQNETSFMFVPIYPSTGEYFIKGIISDGTYEVEHEWIVTVNASTENKKVNKSSEEILQQNYPNPLVLNDNYRNFETQFDFFMNNPGNVELSIFNTKGQLVNTLLDKYLPKGNNNIKWNGQDKNGNTVSTGIYFYRLKTDDTTLTKKLLIVR